MKILLWAPFGAGEHYWGPGTSAYRLYRIGLPPGVTVTLAHGYQPQQKYPDVFATDHLISDLAEAKPWTQLQFLRNSWQWIRENSPQFDVVHALGLNELAFRPALWFESRGVPVVMKVTGLNNLVTHSRLSRYLGIVRSRNRRMQSLSAYISISSDISKELSIKGVDNEQIHAIPNGVNVDLFKPASEEERSSARGALGIQNKFTVLFLGGISRRKNPHLVLEAVQDIVRRGGQNIQLLIVGPDRSDDGYGNIIKRHVEKLGLTGNCRYINETSMPEMCYKASDLFVLPSSSEGLSNSLLEALASGLPSLVTPISGSRDLVKHGVNGFHVPPQSKAIADRIRWYYENPDLHAQHAQSAREAIIHRYTATAVLAQHLSLFESLLQRRGRTGNRFVASA